MSGLKLAALYGFYPYRLGFCGVQKESAKKIISRYLSGEKIPEQKIRKILETFKGAFSYYKLIAKSNGIEDPFDEKVVKAYWLGNQLSEKVPIAALRKMLIKEFTKRGLLSKELAEEKAREIPLGSMAHHSFHVLVIGSVAGPELFSDGLLDICRIGWGRVIKKLKIRNKTPKELLYNPTGQELKILIEYQPLIKNRNFTLGKFIKKEIFWDKDFIPRVRVGDNVATHWNYVVQVLNKRDLLNLKKYTHLTIDSLNE